MYEFVPLLFSLVAIVYYLMRGAAQTRCQRAEADGSEAPTPQRRRSQPGRRLAVRRLSHLLDIEQPVHLQLGRRKDALAGGPPCPAHDRADRPSSPATCLSRLDWRAVWRRGGAVLALLLPVTLFGLYTLVTLQPFQGLSLFKLQETGNWFAALLVTLLLLVLTWIVVPAAGDSSTRWCVALATAAGLSVLLYRALCLDGSLHQL